MFVELVDLLRCPRPHEDSWLVAAAVRQHERHIVTGTLGCPVCHAEYPVVDAVADFGRAPAAPGAALAIPHRDEGERAAEAMRLAALLDLTSPGGTVLLGPTWADCADALLALVDVRLLVLDPLAAPPLREALSAVHGGGALPVAAGALRAAALDANVADDARVAAVVRAVRSRGRVVAPAGVPLPDGVRELARDERQWVAEREPAPSPIVPLRRGGEG